MPRAGIYNELIYVVSDLLGRKIRMPTSRGIYTEV
jgi:hypothetical protein